MAGGRPEAEVGQDLLDHVGLLDEGDDAHWSTTPGADQRVHLADLLDEARPSVIRLRWAYLTELTGDAWNSPYRSPRLPGS